MKIITIKEAIDLVDSNSSIMATGFAEIGAPICLFDALAESGKDGLTLITAVTSYPGPYFKLDQLFENKQIKKFVGSHIGTSMPLSAQYLSGETEVEFIPMGTFAEMVHAGGAGLGGVITPVGVDTLLEDRRQTIVLDDKKYLIYPPLKADFSFIKGFKIDTFGNIKCKGTTKNLALQMALAGKTVIAEVDEIVEAGDIAPDEVEVPGILIDYAVQGHSPEEYRKVYTDLWESTNSFLKEEK